MSSGGRNYQNKGDQFTKKVLSGEWSGVAALVEVVSTGRRFYRKVRADECKRLDFDSVADELGADLDGKEVLWSLPFRDVLRFRKLGENRTGREIVVSGRLLCCPMCGDAKQHIYACHTGKAGAVHVVPLLGCRECLGLTYADQQEHGSTKWARRLLSGRAGTQGGRAIDRARGILEGQTGKAGKVLERMTGGGK